MNGSNLSTHLLEEEVKETLGMNINDNEIKQALFKMNMWKEHGLDGYPARFYQKSWNVVGKSVCDYV